MLFYTVGYVINYIAPGRCKETKDAWIPNSTGRLNAIETGYSSLNTDMTSPAYCAHRCRKQYGGFCPFILAGINGPDINNAGYCGRSVPQHESDCNHATYLEVPTEIERKFFYDIFSTLNFGMFHYSIVFNVYCCCSTSSRRGPRTRSASPGRGSRATPTPAAPPHCPAAAPGPARCGS